MAKSAGVIPALLALVAAGLSGPVAVAAEKGGVFLLPVEAKWPAIAAFINEALQLNVKG